MSHFRNPRQPTALRCLSCVASTPASIAHRTARQATFQAGATSANVDLAPPNVVRQTASYPLSNVTTASLLRSWCLRKVLSSRLLSRPGLAVLKAIATSRGLLLNPDRNSLLNRILKTLVYDQFCAGVNGQEVRRTIAGIKQQGYEGVVLCHAREDCSDPPTHKASRHDVDADVVEEIERWRKRNLETLALMGPGDVLGVKVTGAGARVTESLRNWTPFPEEFRKAIREICDLAQAKGSRVWIDAEKQAVQDGIDHLAIDLMRVYNTGKKPVVYSTIQAYLKDSRLRMHRQLQLSVDEGWTLAIKLVRGAYLETDKRSRIHDTKANTDASYDGLVRSILHHSFPGSPLCAAGRPALEVVVAGHNRKSIFAAHDLALKLDAVGSLRTRPEFAQLQGMADDIGSELVNAQRYTRSQWRPRVYKYLTWGSVQDCMLYLVRRTEENQGGANALLGGSEVLSELKRRLLHRLDGTLGVSIRST